MQKRQTVARRWSVFVIKNKMTGFILQPVTAVLGYRLEYSPSKGLIVGLQV